MLNLKSQALKYKFYLVTSPRILSFILNHIKTVKIYTSIDEIQDIPNPVLTIGTFDGVHVGHQKIIEKVINKANEVGGESVLFTFYPHPRMVVNSSNHGIKLIQSQEEKIEKLEKLGVQHLLIIPFTKEFSEISADDFVSIYLVNQLNIHTLIVGYDHQFGKNREGNLEFLKNKSFEYSFEIVEIPAHDIDDVNVSSTKIRKSLEQGDVATANHYLGEPFQIWGEVIHGKKLGNTIGYPTANIQVNNPLKLIPAKGVYAVSVLLEDGNRCFGMMNCGSRPTVSTTEDIHIEVHLFDFNENIYDRKLKIELHAYLRQEQRFENIDVLIKQLQQDEISVRTFFGI